MNRRGWIGSGVLLGALFTAAAVLAAWKRASTKEADEASAHQPEPTESVTAAVARAREYRRTTTSIGTIVALRSITLRNEIPGTVREVTLPPAQIVEAGAVLVTFDVSVEEAELKALELQAALAETMLDRMQRAGQNRAASEIEVEKSRSERDVALARIARTKAMIARKTIRAPFRARVGLSDLHPGQYLLEGTQLTTLQGVDDAVFVDFSVPQGVAAGLREGDAVEVLAVGEERAAVAAKIVALDARIDRVTRTAWVRARIEGAASAPAPGASTRVRIPVGPPVTAVAVSVSGLRKGPGGDHVFVIAPDKDGKTRATSRPVESGMMLGDEVLILSGLKAGERIAESGSFKLRDGVLVAIAADGKVGGVGTP